MKQSNNAIKSFTTVRFSLVIAFIFTLFSASAQKDFGYIFKIQGIDFGRSKIFDFEGTTIEVHKYSVPLSADICQDAKKQNRIKRKAKPIVLSGFGEYPIIYSEIDALEGGFQKVSTVFLFEKDGIATYVSFHGWKVDTILYQKFLSAYNNNMLTSGLFVSSGSADSIYFLEKKIILGPACNWMGPRNVQCKHKGQINWSIHPDLKNAEEAAQFQFYFTQSVYPMKAISEENVSITFAGKSIFAKRVVWKVKGIRGFLAKEMDGSNKLVAFYIATEVNGEYVHGVLSHWDNDLCNEKGLPPLLSQVMMLQPLTTTEKKD